VSKRSIPDKCGYPVWNVKTTEKFLPSLVKYIIEHFVKCVFLDTWEAWLTIAVACTLVVGLALRVAATDLLALFCLGILVLVQNITGSESLPTPEQAVAGFGNQGLITIALLFAVVAGLECTGGTELATGWFLNKAKNLTSAQARLFVPVAVLEIERAHV